MTSSQTSGRADNRSITLKPWGAKHLFILFTALLAVFFVFGGSAGPVEGSVVPPSSGGAGGGQNAPSGAVDSLFGMVSAKQSFGPDTPELLMVGGSGLLAATPSMSVTPKVLGMIVGNADGFDSDVRSEVTKYIVQDGDTPTLVAEKFNVSLNTILWANSLAKSSRLKIGQELVVLPVSGALHMVRQNETIGSIALLYKAKADDIIEFNQVSPEAIFAGDFLVIPNGVMPSASLQASLIPIANSYFIVPIPSPSRVTQGLHSFNAVDLSTGKCGDPVFAAAGGTVQRTGYTSIGGNYARVLHPNGVVTYYGHLSAASVAGGEKVLQGQIIGYIGYTGYTIPKGPGGCHVHFEVRGAVNPFAQ